MAYNRVPRSLKNHRVDARISERAVNELCRGVPSPEGLKAIETHFRTFHRARGPSLYIRYIKMVTAMDPGHAVERIGYLLNSVGAVYPQPNPSPLSKKSDSKFWLEIGTELLRNGHTSLAMPILRAISGDDSVSSQARELEQFAQSLRTVGNMNNGVQSPNFTSGAEIVSWSPSSGSRKIIFFFAGGAGGAFLTLAVLHKFLEKVGCHIVYIVSRVDSFAVQGSDWTNPFELTSKLRAIAARLSAQQVYVAGNSSGGYAALWQAVEIEAEAVLAFSPVVSPLHQGSVDTRLRFERLHRDQSEVEFDLIKKYQKAKRLPRTMIAFGGEFERDRRAAESMRNFPRISLVPAPGFSQHNSIKWFLMNNRLLPMFIDLVGPSNES